MTELHLAKLLTPGRIALHTAPPGRVEAIDALIALHASSGVLSDPARYRADVLLREEEGSTALGRNLAIPHAKSAGVLRPALAAMTVREGVDWEAPDQGPARLLFMIAAPLEGGDLHLQILARLMKTLVHGNLPQRLITAAAPAAFLAALVAEEGMAFPQKEHNGGTPWSKNYLL